MKKIAVLTSGGDAPGMNGAIRSVTRCAVQQGWTVVGVERGFCGLLEGAFREMSARDVGGILHQGGTVLGSARSPEFKRLEFQKKALERLREEAVEALVVIGGNGSQTGAAALSGLGFPVVGIASTIDNDLLGSDITIGVDTALNTAVCALDRLRTTARSHQRAFLVEVMGRDCGYLALMTGLAAGAELVVEPEVAVTPFEVAETLQAAYARGKRHGLVVVAEGAQYNARAIEDYFIEHQVRLGLDLRVVILGHLQRGGAPSVFDRILSSRLGAGAVEALASGRFGVLIGLIKGEVSETPLEEIVGATKPVNSALINLASVLER